MVALILPLRSKWGLTRAKLGSNWGLIWCLIWCLTGSCQCRLHMVRRAQRCDQDRWRPQLRDHRQRPLLRLDQYRQRLVPHVATISLSSAWLRKLAQREASYRFYGASLKPHKEQEAFVKSMCGQGTFRPTRAGGWWLATRSTPATRRTGSTRCIRSASRTTTGSELPSRPVRDPTRLASSSRPVSLAAWELDPLSLLSGPPCLLAHLCSSRS